MNNKSANKTLIFVLAGIFLSGCASHAPVYAASFDCNKASTKIEKMICSNPELSKLDDELGKVYLKMIKDVGGKYKNELLIRRLQKGWLFFYRRKCEDAQCLKDVYQKRIKDLRYILSYEFETPKVIYPPYPNIWDFKPPARDSRTRGTWFSSYRMENGSFLIYYGKPKGKVGSRMFFEGGQSVDPESMSVATYKLKGFFRYKSSIELSNQATISIKNLDTRIVLRCPQHLNNYYEIKYADGSTKRKSLIYFLEKPSEVTLNDRCVYTDEKNSYYAKVETMYGKILPLNDGGFLLEDSRHGIIFRFDSNFNTKSKLLGTRFVIVDTDKLTQLGINKFEEMNYKKMHDKVFQFAEKYREGRF